MSLYARISPKGECVKMEENSKDNLLIKSGGLRKLLLGEGVKEGK